MQIIQDISVTGALSPQQIAYFMEPYYTGVTINNTRLQEEFTIKKQEQCIQVCYIRTGLETFIDQ